MAEQNSGYEFSSVEARDILAERERGWEGFTRFIVYSIAAIVVVLAGLAFFVG